MMNHPSYYHQRFGGRIAWSWRAVVGCVVVSSCAALAAGADSPVAVPVDGEPFSAKLAGADGKWQLSFGSGEKQRSIAAGELVCWGTCAEPRRGPIVVTADGGLLVADVFRVEKESLTADSRLFGPIELALDSLSGIVFELPAARSDRDLLLDRVARAQRGPDRLVLHNGDEVTGVLQRIEDDTVYLETDTGAIEIDTHRITALIFNPGLKRRTTLQGLRVWAGLSDGSRLLATRLVMDSSSLEITAAGRTWKTTLPEELVFLQPLGRRVAYLSDLNAVEYKPVSFLSENMQWPYHTDRNAAGGRLRGGGRLVLKGLGVHSRARLTYALQKQYKRFQAELAVDDSTAGGGSVRYRVFVDGKAKYTSQPVRGGDVPVSIAVDLSGARRLDLVVDYAERGDELDYANWLNARLVK